jgi:hypothetical protein
VPGLLEERNEDGTDVAAIGSDEDPHETLLG